jgi:predicted GNAT superfamily acetyltransferase
MAEAVSIRPLSSLEDVRAASALFDRIWGERRVMGAPLLRAMASHGGQVLGAFDREELIGALVGLVGLTEDGRPVLHSHITGVAPESQHRGVGFLLKRAQREWCLARGLEVVTWTMDPMVARNARFNIHKLGAVGSAFHRDYYGPMEDAFNRGERSDRLEIRWDLRSDRVAAAMDGRGAEPVVTDPTTVVRVPEDYHALRERDEAEARRWRDRVADELEAALAAGFEATGFLREGAYVMERT